MLYDRSRSLDLSVSQAKSMPHYARVLISHFKSPSTFVVAYRSEPSYLLGSLSEAKI